MLYAVAEIDLSHVYMTTEDLDVAKKARTQYREIHPERHPVIMSKESSTSTTWTIHAYIQEGTMVL